MRYLKNLLKNIKYLLKYDMNVEYLDMSHDIYRNNNRLEKIPRRIQSYDEDRSNIHYKINKLEDNMEDKLLFIQAIPRKCAKR